jgi:MFS family permease
MGYVGLGCAVMLLAFIPVTIWCGEPAEATAIRQKGFNHLPGLELSQAIRSRGYWGITIAISFALMAINGTLVHVVPMLTDRGLPVARATAALSAAGLMLIAGRVLAGYMLDKIFASYIAIFFLVCPMIGIAILGFGLTGVGPMIGTVLLGMGVGAEHDLAAFMISRYFGVKAFGAMHGLLFVFAGIAVALGSILLGWCYQLRHSYSAGLVFFEILLGISIVIMAFLGPYRYPAVKRELLREPERVAVAQ